MWWIVHRSEQRGRFAEVRIPREGCSQGTGGDLFALGEDRDEGIVCCGIVEGTGFNIRDDLIRLTIVDRTPSAIVRRLQPILIEAIHASTFIARILIPECTHHA